MIFTLNASLKHSLPNLKEFVSKITPCVQELKERGLVINAGWFSSKHAGYILFDLPSLIEFETLAHQISFLQDTCTLSKYYLMEWNSLLDNIDELPFYFERFHSPETELANY